MRSIWKGPFIDPVLLRKQSMDTLRSRRSTIMPNMEGRSVKVYTGQSYVWFPIKAHHIGHKYGDFVLTRKRCMIKLKTTAKRGAKG